MKPFVYILAIAMASCANPRLVQRSSNSNIEANLSDTLHWHRAIVSSRLVDNLSRERESNQEALLDTVFSMFETAISKSQVPIHLAQPVERVITPYFEKKRQMPIRYLKNDSILALVQEPANTSVIPFVYLEEKAWLNISSSLAGGFSGGGINKQSWVIVMIYVVKNNEVIYRSNGLTFGEPYLVDKLTDSQMNIEEEKMDALIALLWRDYLKAKQKKTKKR